MASETDKYGFEKKDKAYDKAFKWVKTKAEQEAKKEISNVEAKPHSTLEGRMSSALNKYQSFKKKMGFQSGGRATHGYGKAYMKGGKVK